MEHCDFLFVIVKAKDTYGVLVNKKKKKLKGGVTFCIPSLYILLSCLCISLSYFSVLLEEVIVETNELFNLSC